MEAFLSKWESTRAVEPGLGLSKHYPLTYEGQALKDLRDHQAMMQAYFKMGNGSCCIVFSTSLLIYKICVLDVSLLHLGHI